MTIRRFASVAACIAIAAGACTSAEKPTATTPQQGDAAAVAGGNCGTETCDTSAFCVETRGAVCRRLPPEGTPCPEGCTRTPHCCSCPSFACLYPQEKHCPSGARCDCLATDADAGVLRSCLPPRRTCTETPEGPRVLCVQVDFDEDPFADSERDGG